MTENGGPTQPFCDWAAARLLAALRERRLPTELTPADINWAPMMDTFRAGLTEEDSALVAAFLGEEATVMWGAAMSRVVDGDEITRALLGAFRRERDIERRIGLLHHISARRLEPAQRDELLAWARENAEQLIADQVRAFDDKGGEARLRLRLQDDRFREKRWVYMYSAHALAPPDARALLRQYLQDGDRHVAEAARHALSLMRLTVLLSYRRTDARHFVGRLHDTLVAQFGSGSVIRDMTLLEPGDEFRQRLVETVSGCSAVLVIIGENWSPERLWSADDVVLLELVTALEAGVRLIPILVEDATMPPATSLPDELRSLSEVHAVRIRDDPDYVADVDRLVRVLDS